MSTTAAHGVQPETEAASFSEATFRTSPKTCNGEGELLMVGAQEVHERCHACGREYKVYASVDDYRQSSEHLGPRCDAIKNQHPDLFDWVQRVIERKLETRNSFPLDDD